MVSSASTNFDSEGAEEEQGDTAMNFDNLEFDDLIWTIIHWQTPYKKPHDLQWERIQSWYTDIIPITFNVKPIEALIKNIFIQKLHKI